MWKCVGATGAAVHLRVWTAGTLPAKRPRLMGAVMAGVEGPWIRERGTGRTPVTLRVVGAVTMATDAPLPD